MTPSVKPSDGPTEPGPGNAADDADQNLEFERIDLALRSMPGFFLSQTITVVIAGAYLWQSMPRTFLIVWLCLAETYVYGRHLLHRLHARQTLEQRKAYAKAWKVFYWRASTGWGALWAALLPIAFATGNLSQQFILSLMLTGVCMMGALYSGRAALGLSRLVMGAGVLSWLLFGDEHRLVMATLATVLLVMFEDVTRRQHALTEEKARLVAATQSMAADLDQRNAELIAANRNKTQLIATASHDLRQPVHAIGMIVEGWRADLPPAEHRERIAAVGARIANMRNMLQGLLDMSRVDLGVFKVSLTAVRIDEFVQAQAESVAASMKRNAVEFNVDVSQTRGLTAETDPGLLARMLINLLTNAFKYTPSGRITLRTQRQPDGVLQISVEDTGLGIPQNQFDRIFREYVRLDHRHAGIEGVGIGLYMVKKTAELLDYKITVQSVEGEGSRFSILIPASHIRPTKFSVAVAPVTHSQAMRILLIEDDQDTLNWTARVLRSAGHEVVAATDTRSAIDATERDTAPQILISDFQLSSSENGLAGIDLVRKYLGAPALPAILLTGDLTVQVRELARTANVRVLNKPLMPSTLLDALREVSQRTQHA